MISKGVLVSVLLASLCVYVTRCQEPSCTKFTFLEQLLEKIVRMEVKMDAYQSQLDSIKDTPEEPEQHTTAPVTQATRMHAAFFASMSANNIYKMTDEVKFDTVTTNIGNAYDPSTGKFRVPVDGTYFFQATLLTGSDVELWAHLTVNGDTKAKLSARGTGGRHGSGTQAVLATLLQDDEVTVSIHGAVYGDKYTTFTGYLLY